MGSQSSAALTAGDVCLTVWEDRDLNHFNALLSCPDRPSAPAGHSTPGTFGDSSHTCSVALAAVISGNETLFVGFALLGLCLQQ